MTPTFFKTQYDFRDWLEENYDKETELIVGYYKVASKKPSMTWSESVDQALCFGWIDGIRRSIDEESYCIRFTPRRKDSIWSAVNVKKVGELKEAGLMKEAGLNAFKHLSKNKSKIYSYEKQIAVLDSQYEKELKKHKAAWGFFSTQAPSYQRMVIHYIMSAKQEKTRISRLDKLIQASQEQKKILW